MTLYVALTSLGIFVINEKSEVVSKQLTYPDTERAAREIFQINEGESTSLIKETAQNIDELDENEFIVDHIALGKRLSSLSSKKITIDETAAPLRWFRDNENEFIQKSGIVESIESVRSFRHQMVLNLSRITLSAASEQKDLLVKNAIDAVSETDKSINVLAMRLREWYSLHHPSLDSLVEDHELYARIVKTCRGRVETTKENLSKIGVPEKLSKYILSELPKDIGADLEAGDLDAVSGLAQRVIDLYDLRREMERYIEELMSNIAPNISKLIGHMVGARLISLAGSLMDLARKPSSTVQVFGAEKALFRSLKTGAAPPKHGVIYQVPEIHSAPYWQRGKIARALAGKISIAARIDAYSGSDVGDKLRADFMKRVEEIKLQNAEEPPEKPKPPPTQKQSRGSRRDNTRRKRK